jgi:hypothetical protein
MLLKNKKYGNEIDFNCKSDKRLAKRIAADPDFEVISMTDEEKELIAEDKALEISDEDKLLGNIPEKKTGKKK